MLAFGFAAIVLLGFTLMHRHVGSTINKDGLFIGTYLYYSNGETDAIRLIATDVRRYPNENLFWVRWKTSEFPDLLGDDTYDIRMMSYDRQRKTLSRGDYGGGSSMNGVTEFILDRAAREENYDARENVFKQAKCWSTP